MFLKVLGAAAIAAFGLFQSAQASTVTGMQCGNKYIGLTQDGSELSPDMCDTGNSTGGQNSPIFQAGWTDSSEYQGNTDATIDSGPVTMEIDRDGNSWSISNPLGFDMLGISIKQGNGYAFYILDASAPLSGMWFTGNGSNPTGNSISHINAWYQGVPASVPLPAAGMMLLAGLGGIGALRRRKKAA